MTKEEYKKRKLEEYNRHPTLAEDEEERKYVEAFLSQTIDEVWYLSEQEDEVFIN